MERYKHEVTNVGKLSMIKAGTRLNINPRNYKGEGHEYTFPELSKLLGIHRVFHSIGDVIIKDNNLKLKFTVTRLNNEHIEKKILGHRWSCVMEIIPN